MHQFTGLSQAISKVCLRAGPRNAGCFGSLPRRETPPNGWMGAMTPQSYSGRGRTERNTSPESQIFISHLEGGLTWKCQAHQPEDLKPLVKLMEQIPCGF